MSPGKGVFISTYFSYNDALIQAYTLPYVRMIRQIIPSDYPVYLFTIEKKSDGNGAITESDKIKLRSDGIQLISVKYKPFGFGLLSWLPTFFKCLRIVRSSGIGTIHAWCTPGGILGYLLSILSGKRLVLDSFEPHAEVMLETGTWKAGSLKFKILFFFEKIMSRHADIHICCTSDMIEYSRKKYGTVINISFTKPACVDLDKFHPSKRKNIQLLSDLGLEGRIVAVYAGKFGGLYLEQECFDFFKAAIDHWGDRFRVLLLTPVSPEIIHTMSQIAGLSDHVIVQRFVPHEDVPILMGLGDFGFAPYRPVPSRKYSAPIKVSEYMAMGLPIVITENIADDSQLIETEGIGAVIKSLDNAGYLSVIHRLDELLKDPEISTKARHKAETLRNFGIAINIYESIYQD